MNPVYPEGLPRGLHSGRKYQLVNPLMRTPLSTGRARQRRRFTSVPEAASVSWVFNDSEGQAFEAWWRDALIDGSLWFECPLDHPMGYDFYTCRFTGVYDGPSRIGPNLWSYSAELELQERAVLPPDWGLFPEFILDASILDYAMNQEWPLALPSGNLMTDDGGFLLTESGDFLTLEN